MKNEDLQEGLEVQNTRSGAVGTIVRAKSYCGKTVRVKLIGDGRVVRWAVKSLDYAKLTVVF